MWKCIAAHRHDTTTVGVAEEAACCQSHSNIQEVAHVTTVLTSCIEAGQMPWKHTMPTMQPRKWAGKTTRKWLEGTRPKMHSTTRTGMRGALSRMKGMRVDIIWVERRKEIETNGIATHAE